MSGRKRGRQGFKTGASADNPERRISKGESRDKDTIKRLNM